MNPIFIARERSLYEASSNRAIQARQNAIAQMQERMSTGLQVNRPSDDPTAFAQARKVEVLTDRYEHYLQSIEAANHWVDHTQQALDGLVELFTEAYERGIRASNDTFSDSDREAFASRIDSILLSVEEQLNTSYGGEYLFSGSRSTVRPFNTAPDGTPGRDEAGYVYDGSSADPSGIRGSRIRHVAPGVTLDIAVNGEEIWRVDFDRDGNPEGANDFTITEALHELAQSMREGDTVQIRTALEHIQVAKDHVTDMAVQSGNKANRLDMLADQLRETNLLFEEHRSELEDADLAETMMLFQREQVGLQAAYKATASILQHTLLDYLK